MIDKKGIVHEIGHTGGLIHTFEPNTKASFPNGRPLSTNLQQFYNISNDPYYEANFMNYTSKAVREFPIISGGAIKFFNNTVGKATRGQIQTIINNLNQGNLNYNNIPKRR